MSDIEDAVHAERKRCYELAVKMLILFDSIGKKPVRELREQFTACVARVNNGD